MRGSVKALIVAGTMVAAALGTAAPAEAQIVTSTASLVNGQLTIVGSGAVPHSTVTVDDAPPFGRADGKGNFSISASGFSEPSCVATLYDGSVSVEVTLTGCTPTISKPPPVPLAPTAVAPPPGASVTEPVALSWQPPTGTHGLSFQWQVSSDPSFTALVLTATVSPSVTSTTLSGLAPGTYYWRVQSVFFPVSPYHTLFSDWTATRSLTITGEAPGTPGTPTLTSPAPGSAFHPEESFPLTWTAVPGAASYRLQMSRRPAFPPDSHMLVDVPESTTTAHAPLFGFETPLFVRVFAVSASGVRGLPSPTLALHIDVHAPVPAPPKLLAPANGATVTMPLTLSWTPDPNPQTGQYQVEFNTTPNFSGGCFGVEKCVTGLSSPEDIQVTLPRGKQFWRVRSFHGLGPSGQAATAWSATRVFTVSNAPPQIGSLTFDVFTGGGTVLRSHTHAFSGTTADNQVFGILQLKTPALKGGLTVSLTSSNPNVLSVRPSLTIADNTAWRAFVVQPLQVLSPAKVTLTASIPGQPSVTAPFTVDPSGLMHIDINAGPPTPNVFSGGTTQVGGVLFNGIAPAGSVISLASSSPDASVPATVTVPKNLPTNFSIPTKQVTASTHVVISATWRGKTITSTMTLQPPPVLRSPAAGASFPTGRVVTFRWTTPFGLSSQLQVAGNPAFSNPVTDFNTNGAQAWALMSLPSGTLYWRVLGVDAYGVQGPSSPVRTIVVRPPSGPLPAPVPKFPANGATVTAGQQVAFFWEPVTGAAKYELQVANSAAFTPPLVLDQTVTGNQFNTSTLPTGTLFWRVRALDSLGNPGAWSVTFQLTVAPASAGPSRSGAARPAPGGLASRLGGAPGAAG